MIDEKNIREKFRAIGTDVDFLPAPSKALRGEPVTVDVLAERFRIIYDPDSEAGVMVPHVAARDRHLLLQLQIPSRRPAGDAQKVQLLCGFDERHYFVCRLPRGAAIGNVIQAKASLMPEPFRDAHGRKGRPKNLFRRKNEAGKRQGEWFFLRQADFTPQFPDRVRLSEPLSRNARSKAHVCREIYSAGGDTVYVHRQHAPNGVDRGEADRITRRLREEGKPPVRFDVRIRGAEVYARGSVRHPDHKTVHLDCWHRVLLNREEQPGGFTTFLD